MTSILAPGITVQNPKLATLGHRVDVVCGGSDSDCNLDLQCQQCNSQIKPHHESLEEYVSWLAEYQRGLMVALMDMHEGEPEDAAEPQSEAVGWWSRWLRRRAA